MTSVPRAQAVAALVAAGRLQEVVADPAAALVRLDRAEEKIAAAEQIVSIDLDIAYVSAYDAMRIAVTAHMLAVGLRVPARNGAHEAVGVYAGAAIASPSARQFQRMRRRRNKAEYDDIVIGRPDVDADMAYARRRYRCGSGQSHLRSGGPSSHRSGVGKSSLDGRVRLVVRSTEGGARFRPRTWSREKRAEERVAALVNHATQTKSSADNSRAGYALAA